MASNPMKNLVIGNDEFEITDADARSDIATLTSDLEDLEDSVDNTVTDLQSAITENTNDIDALEETVTDGLSSLNSAVTQNTADIATQTARIDNIASLTAGSTTGDAELQDIRVGADGVTYADAGTAVRTQISNQISDFQLTSDLADIDKNHIAIVDTSGSIYWTNGTDYSTSSIQNTYARSGFVYCPKGSIIIIQNFNALTSECAVAVYDKSKTFDQSKSIKGQGASVDVGATIEMPYDGYVRFSSKKSSLSDAKIYNATKRKKLRILVLGNSFSQDSFAYLPPVLNELLPEYLISYGVAYTSSADVQDHVNFYRNNTAYTWFNSWEPHNVKWVRTASTYTLTSILNLHDWDLIYVQSASSVSTDAIKNNVIVPMRTLLRILQLLANNQFSLFTGQWLATDKNGDHGVSVFNSFSYAMRQIKAGVGITDFIPIGTAIQNARSNALMQVLGDTGNMLYDNTHQQSGLPALISTYTIALQILKQVGKEYISIYHSTFKPTMANCIAINAYKAEGMVSPLPMTHGDPVGVTDDFIRAGQEVAVLAMNNPLVITDCSDIVVHV